MTFQGEKKNLKKVDIFLKIILKSKSKKTNFMNKEKNIQNTNAACIDLSKTDLPKRKVKTVITIPCKIIFRLFLY